MDLASIFGLLIGFGMIILGFTLEKGTLASLVLLSPAVIVFGGTFGAVTLSYPLSEIIKLPKLVLQAFRSPKNKIPESMKILMEMSEISRKEGLLSLEKYIREKKGTIDPFIRKGTLLAINGSEAHDLRDLLENDISIMEQRKKIEASIFESAGGYSPTLGIIGTVMGLIQVLSNMDSPEELAKSIATAFIATLYGVCFANLFYLPIASKLKLRIKLEKIEKEMIIEGLCSIIDGENTAKMNDRLSAYTTEKMKDVQPKTK